MEMVVSMVTALILISIILISGGFRLYFRKKFNIDDEIEMINRAAKRHTNAKQRLHNVQH